MAIESWTNAASSKPLTAESLGEAFDRIANEPVVLCGVSHPHAVHPAADGWTRCGICASWVNVTDTPEGKRVNYIPPPPTEGDTNGH